jgi:hypothetical protein
MIGISMKNNNIKLLFIISIILFCAFAVMRWLFNDHEFRYGDLNYYLLTDQKIRCFPIIGAKPSAVFYKSYFQDGTSPGMLKMTYNSSMTPQEAIKAFKKACIRLGYTPLPVNKQVPNIINYSSTGKYETISLMVTPQKSDGCLIEIGFVEQLE